MARALAGVVNGYLTSQGLEPVHLGAPVALLAIVVAGRRCSRSRPAPCPRSVRHGCPPGKRSATNEPRTHMDGDTRDDRAVCMRVQWVAR